MVNKKDWIYKLQQLGLDAGSESLDVAGLYEFLSFSQPASLLVCPSVVPPHLVTFCDQMVLWPGGSTNIVPGGSRKTSELSSPPIKSGHMAY